MLLFLQFFASRLRTETHVLRYFSTVIVTDDTGVQLDIEDVEFCQRFQSEDYKPKPLGKCTLNNVRSSTLIMGLLSFQTGKESTLVPMFPSSLT